MKQEKCTADHIELPLPYGMWRTEENRHWGWVLLVSGKQNCEILWRHGIPALGIHPGIDWDGEWKFSLEGLEVYVMGEAVMRTIRQAPEAILDLTVLRCIPGDVDVRAAHLQGQDLFSIINFLRTRADHLSPPRQNRTPAISWTWQSEPLYHQGALKRAPAQQCSSPQHHPNFSSPQPSPSSKATGPVRPTYMGFLRILNFDFARIGKEVMP